jgi:hypothetical protein
MKLKRRVVWVGWSVLGLALVACGRVTPRDGVEGGVAPPQGAGAPDAGLISITSRDAGSGPPGLTKDAETAPPTNKDAGATPTATKDAAGAPPNMPDGGAPPPPGTGGAPGMGDNGQGCSSKNDCHGLVCDALTGLCVECLVNSDCKGKTKICDPATLTCLGCASDDDCDGDKKCVLGVCG